MYWLWTCLYLPVPNFNNKTLKSPFIKFCHNAGGGQNVNVRPPLMTKLGAKCYCPYHVLTVNISTSTFNIKNLKSPFLLSSHIAGGGQNINVGSPLIDQARGQNLIVHIMYWLWTCLYLPVPNFNNKPSKVHSSSRLTLQEGNKMSMSGRN